MSGWRPTDGAHHQVYLLRRDSLIDISKSKGVLWPPGGARVPDLPSAVNHRERTVVVDGDESHGSGGREGVQVSQRECERPISALNGLIW